MIRVDPGIVVMRIKPLGELNVHHENWVTVHSRFVGGKDLLELVTQAEYNMNE